MKLRIDYKYARETDKGLQFNYQLCSNAPTITKISELKSYLREFALGWVGTGKLVILSVSRAGISSVEEDELMESLSDRVSGQVIEFDCGKVKFLREKIEA
ncbi:hypothetical protein CJF42_03340 [Pseudoalteromonas sp. NBT06-2]|uniref:hypothetical protein n=1 Tax=Pseudoalteromonas sp. NBT06-2 TaxID=2025950 RepID=UPI000BA5106B|nr:hypothetical protein [Pseudoalteromonas sp. NBT06-2]PAJ75765.1 hypothetical protein CJF42_03340 [Pseudoalteromonas sp. NBT06-2]